MDRLRICPEVIQELAMRRTGEKFGRALCCVQRILSQEELAGNKRHCQVCRLVLNWGVCVCDINR